MILRSAVMLMLAACAATPSEEAPPAQYGALAAPTPADIAVKITEASKDQSVAVRAGTRIAVELVGTPTAGFIWTPTQTPPFLSPAGEYGGPTSAAQLEPGFAGGNHWEGFVFDVTAAGAGVLRFEQRRAWDEQTPDPDGASFSVTVVAGE